MHIRQSCLAKYGLNILQGIPEHLTTSNLGRGLIMATANLMPGASGGPPGANNANANSGRIRLLDYTIFFRSTEG